MTAEQAEAHPYRHSLTNFLGMSSVLTVETGKEILDVLDTIVICTDGISNNVSPEELCSVALHETHKNACRRLVKMADQRAGSRADNMSVIVIKLGETIANRGARS